MHDLAVLDPANRPAPTADADNGRPTIQPAVLRGEALVKRFGSTEALRGLDVEVGRGEILAVMGPSGSGKSTLLHCLAAIVRPDEGRVLYDGARIDDLGESARTRLRRNAFGFVFQFGQLVPELPAVENVALPLLLDGVKRCGRDRPGGRDVPAAGSGRARGPAAGRDVRWPGAAGGGRAGPSSRGRPSCSPTSPPGRSTRCRASR